VKTWKRVWELGLLLGFPVLVYGDLIPASEDGLSIDAIERLALEVRGKGWICYGARSDAGDWDLYLSRPDGSGRRNITKTPERNEFAPQFSRDGSKLIYRRISRRESIEGNRYGEQGELVLARSDGWDPATVGTAGEFPWATWSPDGRQLACLSLKGISLFEVRTRQLLRVFERRGFFQQITWSPDGQWIAGVANSFGTSWSIARMNLGTGEVSAVNRVDCCTPDWLPDSQQVIFSWRPPGQKENKGQGWTQLWRADVDGKVRQLVYGEDGRHVYGGHVSPDGNYVLFTGNMEEDGDPRNAGGPMGLMRLGDAPIIGGESRELRALHPGARTGPVVTLPAGWEPCWTLSELPRSGISNKPANHSNSIAAMRSELHERGCLIFSARTEVGDWDLFVMRPDGSDRRQVTRTQDFNEAGARFSPDGTRLLYYRMPKAEPVDNNNYGTFELVLANADGSGAVVYGSAFPWASWGPDSRQFACLTPKGIQMIEIATRKVVRQVSRKGIVEQLVWSPDGRRFVGTANGLGPFWNIGVLDPDSEKITAISETERYNCTPDWCQDGTRVVYARGIIPQRPGRAELWMAKADGSARERLYAEAGRHIYGACPSPDGKYLVFTRSLEDLGKVPEIEMAVIRWPGEADPREAATVPRLDLGSGWEPHWTLKEMAK